MDPSYWDHTCRIKRKYLSGETCWAAAWYQRLERLSGIQLHLCYSIEAEREPKAGQDPDWMAGGDFRCKNGAKRLETQAFQRLKGRAYMPTLYGGNTPSAKKQQMKQQRSKTSCKSEARSRLHGRTWFQRQKRRLPENEKKGVNASTVLGKTCRAQKTADDAAYSKKARQKQGAIQTA